MNLNEAAENAYKSLYRKRKNNEILYYFLLFVLTQNKKECIL